MGRPAGPPQFDVKEEPLALLKPVSFARRGVAFVPQQGGISFPLSLLFFQLVHILEVFSNHPLTQNQQQSKDS
jgi:hypothetical protein